MKLFIPKDIFDNPKPPRLFLCTPDKKIIGELSSYDETLDGKWGSYSELRFSIDRKYTDILTGKAKVNPLFDKAEGLRKVYVENIGYFIIQDPDMTYGDKDSKTLSCFSSEYETANKYLENFRINTGEIDSKEVIALESEYGYNYTIDKDNLYKLTIGNFNPYTKYYVKTYTDNDSYTYEQVGIDNEDQYNNYDGQTVATALYEKNYPNVQFYLPTNPKLSLLHLIFEKIPGWKIGNVDIKLGRKERTFNEDRIAVYDFLMNEIQDTFKCVVEWDTLTYTVNFYEEEEDGITEDNEVQSRWETNVFISRDNLANEININYSTDDIKTKLKVSGANDLNIREVNLGQNYIMNLGYYHNLDWMEQDLFEAYDDYLETVKEYTPQYTQAMQNWVGANNKYNDFMNAVPAEGNVVLVGDLFKKLYCIYGLYNPINEFIENTTYYVMSENGSISEANPQPNVDNFQNGIYYIKGDFDTKQNELIKRLTLYHINEDTGANNPDNILLRLKNKNSDIATIRIYNIGTKTEPVYNIQSIVVKASSGIEEAAKEYGIGRWINGELTAEEMGLEEYTIQYIGIMGAYFVLTKDERQEENLEEYGVNLLKEKHKTYTTIFQTQTEAMLSQEKYQCIVQDEQPEGNYDKGTRWLDTNSSPVVLKEYDGEKWNIISAVVSETDQINYENYQRYIDNYEKMVAVQNVLIRKEKQAQYMSEGYNVANRNINIDLYTKDDDGEFRYNGQTLEGDMRTVAEAHFLGHSITRQKMDQTLPMFTFTTSYDPNNTFVVYLKETVPYVAYANSRGTYETIKNWITKQTDFENFFTEDQWIRLSSFIREDEFSDSNFLLTGYESEEERLEICKELMETASKELKTLSQPSLEFSMNMANILALQEFSSLFDQFQLGNFIRVHLYDNYIKRTRLLEIHLNFSDLSDFSCTFGNLVTTKSEIDKHADLLAQAVTAGKQVATSAGDWQRAVDKSNKLEQDITNGLTDAVLEVGKASGQSIIWGDYGIWGRKLMDGTTDQYDPEQFRIINNKLLFSNDGFKTSKAVFGKYTVNGEERWGPLAEYVTADTIEGKFISGGSIEIGAGETKFTVDENGNVQIKVGGQDKYASTDALKEIDNAYRFRIVLSYDKSTVFSDREQDCTITCKIYDYDEDITDDVIIIGGKFSWIRVSADSEKDNIWNSNHMNKTGTNANKVRLSVDDIEGNAQFSCSVDFDETKITT